MSPLQKNQGSDLQGRLPCWFSPLLPWLNIGRGLRSEGGEFIKEFCLVCGNKSASLERFSVGSSFRLKCILQDLLVNTSSGRSGRSGTISYSHIDCRVSLRGSQGLQGEKKISFSEIAQEAPQEIEFREGKIPSVTISGTDLRGKQLRRFCSLNA